MQRSGMRPCRRPARCMLPRIVLPPPRAHRDSSRCRHAARISGTPGIGVPPHRGGRRFAVCSALIGRRMRRAPSHRRLPSCTGCSAPRRPRASRRNGDARMHRQSFQAPMAQPDTPDQHGTPQDGTLSGSRLISAITPDQHDNPTGQHAGRVRHGRSLLPNQHDNPPGQHAPGGASPRPSSRTGTTIPRAARPSPPLANRKPSMARTPPRPGKS